MKTYLSILFCLLTALPVAATSISDTIVDAREVHRLIVTQDSTWRVNIEGMANDSSYRQTLTLFPDSYERIKASEVLVNSMNFNFPLNPKKSRQPSSSEINFALPSLGWMIPIDAPAHMGNSVGASIDIDWDLAYYRQRLKNRKHSFDFGLGLNWRRLKLTGKQHFEKTPSAILLSAYPAGSTPDYSQLKTFGPYIPLRYNYTFAKRSHVFLGVNLRFVTRSSIKTLYTDAAGEPVKDFHRGIHTTQFCPDIKAGISIHHVGVFVKYTPVSAFQKEWGPQFQTVSVGIQIN